MPNSIRCLQNLENLDLRNCRALSWSIFYAIPTDPKLSYLDISKITAIGESPSPQIGFMALAEKMGGKLRGLEMAECNPSADSLMVLAKSFSTNLERLDLADCFELTNAILIEMAKNMPRMLSLDLTSCRLVNEEGVRAIVNHCPKLTHLNLMRVVVPAQEVVMIAQHLLHITHLSLGGNYFISDLVSLA